MPSVSGKQKRFMAMCSFGKNKPRKKCPPMKVAKEFARADQARAVEENR